MSRSQQQTFINAPVEIVWELISDIKRHSEWWPRVEDLDCESVGEGCTYREVVRTPMGKGEMNMHIDGFKEPEEFRIHCTDSGAFVRFALTSAQGGTFVEGEMGVEPDSFGRRVFDATVGKRFFRRWLEESLDAMGETAEGKSKTAA